MARDRVCWMLDYDAACMECSGCDHSAIGGVCLIRPAMLLATSRDSWHSWVGGECCLP